MNKNNRIHQNKHYQSSARVLKAMAHPVRLAILDVLLVSEEACVCHMEVVLSLRQAYLSQHLMALREAGVVTDRRDGRNIYYRISNPSVLDLISQIRSLDEETSRTIPLQAEACVCPKCSHIQHTVREV